MNDVQKYQNLFEKACEWHKTAYINKQWPKCEHEIIDSFRIMERASLPQSIENFDIYLHN